MAVKKRTTKDNLSTSPCYTYTNSVVHEDCCLVDSPQQRLLISIDYRWGFMVVNMVSWSQLSIDVSHHVIWWMGTKFSEEPATPNMEAAGSFEMLVPVYQTNRASHARGFPLIFIIWVLRCNLNDATRTEKTLTITADTSQWYRIPKLCQLGCSKLE